MVRAGRMLGITQSGVTRALAVIERSVGGALCARSRRGMEPTDLCRTIVAQARPIIAMTDELNATVSMLHHASIAEIAVGPGPYAMETLALNAAARFTAEGLNVKLRLVAGDAMQALREVRSRSVDFAIAEMPQMEDLGEFVTEALSAQSILLLTRPGHPLSSLSTVTMADVLRYPAVVTSVVATRIGLERAKVRRAASRPGPCPPFPAVVLDCLSASLTIVAESDAVTCATEAAAALALRAGVVVALPLRLPWLVTNYSIASLRNRKMTPSAARFGLGPRWPGQAHLKRLISPR